MQHSVLLCRLIVHLYHQNQLGENEHRCSLEMLTALDGLNSCSRHGLLTAGHLLLQLLPR